MNAVVFGGALLYLLAGLWPSLGRGVQVASVRLTICGLLLVGAAISITGGFLVQRALWSHLVFTTVHGVVAVIAVALAAGGFSDPRRERET
ncbi:hypothetical protein [Mycolicibacterium goodii]|uniref:hypothetical protein n=1 Tax=Mycolicibacterium goodii TaxID=134601 RepID=UPI001BDD6FE4|nr:hypothetical protein [Mycolicibacterium goodii]MBU8833930.1 hypothetical protein [Mycolicibacterium goodii]